MNEANISVLRDIILEVKPSITSTEVHKGVSLMDDLGLDSLDMLQLARKIRRRISGDFDQEAWLEEAPESNWGIDDLLSRLSG